MTTILVTGGAGYVGSVSVESFLAAGHDVVVLDDLTTGHRAAVVDGARLVVGSYGNQAEVTRLLEREGIEAILHCAARSLVGESIVEPAKYYRDNVAGGVALLEAARAAGVGRVVFSSTAAVYGTPVEVPIPEDHPLAPLSPYGDSKLFVERMLRWYGDAYGLRWAALRYFNAAGADPDGEIGEDHDPETHLIPLAIEAALGGKALDIYGTDYPTADGTAIRDYIHVQDLADAHVSALARLRAGATNLCLNLGTGRGHSVREVIAAVEAVSGKKVPAREVGRRAGDPPELVADARLAADVLGWQARIRDMETIVEHAWRWRQKR